MFRLKRLACSFCGRSEKDVAKLVAGPKVYICDRCALEVVRIMDGTGDPGSSRPDTSIGVLKRALRLLFPTRRQGTQLTASSSSSYAVPFS